MYLAKKKKNKEKKVENDVVRERTQFVSLYLNNFYLLVCLFF